MIVSKRMHIEAQKIKGDSYLVFVVDLYSMELQEKDGIDSMRWIVLLLVVCPSLLSAFSFNTGERVQLYRHRDSDPSKETERHQKLNEKKVPQVVVLCNNYVTSL
jgi:hypothetical protein